MADTTVRLKQLAHAVADHNWDELSMRIPAEPERDADLVLLRAAKEIESLRATISRLREYARHDPSCKSWGRIPCPCDCGYDDLIKELGNE